MTTHYLLLCLLLTCISCAQPQNAHLPIPAEDTVAIAGEPLPEPADAIASPVEAEVVIDTLNIAGAKPDSKSAPKAKPAQNASINGKWELVLFNKVAPDSILYPRAIPFLLIDEAAGKFSGSSGCNRIGGSLIKTEGTIRLSKIISTRMLCRESNEVAYLAFLNSVDSYKVKKGKLILKSKDGEAEYKLITEGK